MSLIDYIFEQQDKIIIPQGEATTPEHKPEMLLIGCVDARKDLSVNLGIPKGKALIFRNIAALIRNVSIPQEHRASEAAIFEFAVKALKIKHIAVMGHTDCGGIRAALDNTDLPSIKHYLSPLDEIKKEIQASDLSEQEKRHRLECESVRLSVKNLRSYDYIAKAESEGEISIHGWVIDLATGKLKKLI